MKVRYSFVDPSAIIAIVVGMVVLAVGVMAFFYVTESLFNEMPVGDAALGTVKGDMGNVRNQSRAALLNLTGSGNSVYNIIGIVMIIGAIMSIIGLIYGYIR